MAEKGNEVPHRQSLDMVRSWATVRGDLQLLGGSDGIGHNAELPELI